MRTINRLTLPVLLASMSQLIACVGTSDQASRPASVPDDYVPVPGGWSHPSCLVEVKRGERVLSDGNIRQPDGTVRTVPPCNHAAYDASGNLKVARNRTATGGPPGRTASPECWKVDSTPCGVGSLEGDYHTWDAYAETTLNACSTSNPSQCPTWLSSNWTVPSNPQYNTEQISYLWNGLQSNDGYELLQPVLGWQAAYCYPNCNYYTVSAWDYENSSNLDGNHNYYSTPVRVYPGQTISGSVWHDGGGYWTVNVDVNGSWATSLETGTSTNHDGQYIPPTGNQFNTVIPGILEVHPPDGWYYPVCDHLPSSGYTFFTDVTLYQNGSRITPAWNTTAVTACNMAAYASSDTVTLTWNAQ